MQGFSEALHGPSASTFYVMSDNGFGTKTNSADTLLRIYAVRPEFKTWTGSAVVGRGTVHPANFRSGQVLPAFTEASIESVLILDPSTQ